MTLANASGAGFNVSTSEPIGFLNGGPPVLKPTWRVEVDEKMPIWMLHEIPLGVWFHGAIRLSVIEGAAFYMATFSSRRSGLRLFSSFRGWLSFRKSTANDFEPGILFGSPNEKGPKRTSCGVVEPLLSVFNNADSGSVQTHGNIAEGDRVRRQQLVSREP